jgi:hypothetical protein
VALYTALKQENESWMLIALVLGLMGITAYLASNTAFEMLSLSSKHAGAATDGESSNALASGQAMLAIH